MFCDFRNSNLQIKEEEYKTSINTASTKKNELVNLFSQMSLAIEETNKRLDDKKKVSSLPKQIILFNL